MADKKPTKTPTPPTTGRPEAPSAWRKAQTIGAPQGPYTPLTHGGDWPLVQLMHSVMGNARRNPGGGPATDIPDLMGLVGGGEGGPGGNAGGTAAGPIARFLGWQRGVPEKGIPHTPMYNVEAPGHPLHRSTVTPATLEHHKIAYTPPPPPKWDDLAVTGQGEQMPSSYFNGGSSVPNPDVTMRDHLLRNGENDRMAQLTQKMGGKADVKAQPKPKP